jgi:hypothetical protein
MKIIKSLAASVIFSAAVITSFAENFKQIEISEVWARPSYGKSKNSAIYMNIFNNGSKDDTLIKAETDVADKTVFHKSGEENGVMKMIHIDQVSVPSGLPVEFKPKGLHVMLINLKQKLKEGDKFKLGLTFEKAGYTEVEVRVISNSDNKDKQEDNSKSEKEKPVTIQPIEK